MSDSELKENKTKTGTTYYTDDSGEIVLKMCTKCSDTKELSLFVKSRKGLGSRSSRCKNCEKESRKNKIEDKKIYDKYYYEVNKEKRRLYQRERRKENPSEFQRYREVNRPKFNLLEKRRRSRKIDSPNTLTESQIDIILNQFDNACALTGRNDNIHLDHVIPLSVSDVGTIKGNIIPLHRNLNSSKGTQNIFEWFPSIKDDYNLSQSRFDSLIKYLADTNGMTVTEFREYVYNAYKTNVGKAN